MLLGKKPGVSESKLQEIPFFSEMTWTPLPSCCLPNMCYHIPIVDKEPVYCLNGPCHQQKRYVGQLRSAARTCCFGDLWCDASSAMQMPPAAFAGYDNQSDKLAAMFLNVYHVAVNPEERDPSKIEVPWCLRGFLIGNILGGLLQSAVFHTGLTASQKLENAMTTHVMLDLAELLAREKETTHGLKRGSCFMAGETCSNLRQLCGFLCIQLTSLPEGYVYKPHDSTEIALEHWFGLIRRQFLSAQFSVRDYWHGSMKQMRNSQKKAQVRSDPSSSEKVLTAVSPDEFRMCAQRSLSAVCQLFSHLTQHCAKKLESKFLKWAADAADQFECEEEVAQGLGSSLGF